MSPIRVFLAEDNEDLSSALELLLSESGEALCVGVTNSLDGMALKACECKADVLVLDIELQGKSSLQRLPALKNELQGCAIVMYSGHANPKIIDAAIAGGAARYVLKSGDFDELFKAIRDSAGDRAR